MKKILLALTLSLSVGTIAQDTIRVMYYNLLKFPITGSSRTDEYRTIMQYAKPDVLAVCELDSEAGGDLVLDNSLNVFIVNPMYYSPV